MEFSTPCVELDRRSLPGRSQCTVTLPRGTQWMRPALRQARAELVEVLRASGIASPGDASFSLVASLPALNLPKGRTTLRRAP